MGLAFLTVRIVRTVRYLPVEDDAAPPALLELEEPVPEGAGSDEDDDEDDEGVEGAGVVDDEDDDPPGTTTVSFSFVTVLVAPLGAAPGVITAVSFCSLQAPRLRVPSRTSMPIPIFRSIDSSVGVSCDEAEQGMYRKRMTLSIKDRAAVP